MGQITPEMGSFGLAGILIVFAVLSIIAAVVALLKRVDDHWQRQEAERAEQAFDKPTTLDDTTLVLISAACATVVAGRFRVRRIHRLLSPHQKRTPWSQQGRLILQGSHSVRASGRK